MRSVFKSSPPGAPRSMVRALSMPRPAYIAAHIPAGPAPTMITSYPCLALCVIRPHPSVGHTQLQSWRLGLAGERSRQLLAKPHRFDFDFGPLRARQLLKRRPAHHRHAMPVPPLLMQQRGRRLDQSLPNACPGLVAVTNNRTPDGFQGLVGEPILPGVEQVSSVPDDRLTLCRCHGRESARRIPPITACYRPLPPRFGASSALRGSSRSFLPTLPPPSRSRPRPAPARRLRAPRPRRRCRRRTRDGGTRIGPAHAPARPPPAGAPPGHVRRPPSPTSARSRWPGRRRARCSAWDRSSRRTRRTGCGRVQCGRRASPGLPARSEEHTSELQSHLNLVCRLLLEKKKKQQHTPFYYQKKHTTQTQDK